MFFLLRALFWTVAVAVCVPGVSQGVENAAGLPIIETLKSDAMVRLARVRAELSARHLRAP